MIFHIDQTSVRLRCANLLDGLPGPDAPEFEERALPALHAIGTLARRSRLVAGATPATLAWGIESRLLLKDRAAAVELIRRAVPVPGKLRRVAILVFVGAAALASWALGRWLPGGGWFALMLLVPLALALAERRDRLGFWIRAAGSSARRQASRAMRQMRDLLARDLPDDTQDALAKYDRIGALARSNPHDVVIGWMHAHAVASIASAGRVREDTDLLRRAYADACDRIVGDQCDAGGQAIFVALVECIEGLRGPELPLAAQLEVDTLLARAPSVGSSYADAYDRIAAVIEKRIDELERRLRMGSQQSVPLEEEVLGTLSELRARMVHLTGPLRWKAERARIRAVCALIDNWMLHGGEATLEAIVQDFEAYTDELFRLVKGPSREFIGAAKQVSAALAARATATPIHQRAHEVRARLVALHQQRRSGPYGPSAPAGSWLRWRKWSKYGP